MLVSSIIWNIDPELFSLGPIHVRWYGLLWAIGIWLALFVVQKLFKNEKLPMEWVDKLFMYTVIGTILGARLGHCFFYEWKPLAEPVELLGITFTYGNHYLTHPWELLYVWRGGLASHGGTIGILIALYLFHRNVSHKGFLWGMDRIVIGAALTGAAIRLGNLMNSEIYGSATDLPWGFIFVRDGQVNPMHPTQIYEMIYCLVAFAVTWWLYWKKQAYTKTGFIFGVGLTIIFATRFLLEFIKLDQEQFESGMLLNMGQVLSIPFIIWGLYLALRPYTKLEK